MNKFDKIFFGAIFGAVFPVTLFLAGWWGTFKYVPENRIFIFAFGGLAIGLTISILLRKKIISKLFYFHELTLILVYIFYSICCFGFFMTVPVFNAMLGIPAGYYVAKRSILLELNKDDTEEKINEAARFTTYIIIVLALISAVIALIDPYTVGSLRAMFSVDESLFGRILFYIIFYDGFVNLDAESPGRILNHIIIFGGLKLIAAQYLITKFTGKIIFNKLYKNKITTVTSSP